jgi:copper(I)-binding protein
MTQWRSRLAVLTITMALGSSAYAQEISVKDAWVRATVPGQKATGAFMELIATRDTALVSAASPVAGVVEIHEMVMDGTVMKMRAMARLDLPGGKKVELKPGGYHVMLLDLKQPLRKGDTVPLTLRTEGKDQKAQTIEIKAEVRDLAAAVPHGKP